MNSANQTLRNTALSTVAAWTEFFLGMLVSIIVARSLAPQDYGHFSFMMWCATVFVIFSNGGLTTGIIKFLAESEHPEVRHSIRQYLGKIQRRLLFFTTVLVLLGVVYLGDFFRVTAPPGLWLLLLAASLVKALYIFSMSANKGREHFGTLTRVILVVAPLNLGANILVAWLSPSLSSFLIVYAGTSLSYLVSVRLMEDRDGGSHQLSPEHISRIHHHLLVTTGSIVLSFLILRQSEVFFLRLFARPEEIGFFNIAFTISFSLSALIPGVYSALLLPMMARESRLDTVTRASRYRASLRYLLMLAGAMAFGTYALGNALITLLYGTAYAPAATVLPWVITGVAIAAVAQAGVSLLVSGDRQLQVLRINLLVAACVLAMDWWAISRWSMAGAGAAFLAGNLLHAGLMLGMAARQLSARWPWRSAVRVVLTGVAAWMLTWGWIQGPGSRMGTTPALLVGALIFSFAYATGTFLFGCWEKEEIRFMDRLSARLPSPLAAPLGLFLARFL